jgi:hypothetical protein
MMSQILFLGDTFEESTHQILGGVTFKPQTTEFYGLGNNFAVICREKFMGAH